MLVLLVDIVTSAIDRPRIKTSSALEPPSSGLWQIADVGT